MKRRDVFPFTAIIGQDMMKLALELNVINPRLGGVLIQGEKGTAKSTAVRALADLLPPRKCIDGCRYHDDPNDKSNWCDECSEKYKDVEPPVKLQSMKVIELPVSATEDRVVGSLDIEEAIQMVNARPRPLALYYFTKDKQREAMMLKQVSYGGGCINDTIVHLATSHMPFGGVGNSGMGGYHGKDSFDTFTHKKSIMKKSVLLDIPIRYAPFKNKLNILKKLM